MRGDDHIPLLARRHRMRCLTSALASSALAAANAAAPPAVRVVRIPDAARLRAGGATRRHGWRGGDRLRLRVRRGHRTALLLTRRRQGAVAGADGALRLLGHGSALRRARQGLQIEDPLLPAPPHIYSDRATCDGANLSDVQLPVGRLICRSCPSTCGAPRLTYGRSMAKAMDFFNLDHARWPELAADRAG